MSYKSYYDSLSFVSKSITFIVFITNITATNHITVNHRRQIKRTHYNKVNNKLDVGWHALKNEHFKLFILIQYLLEHDQSSKYHVCVNIVK